MNFYSNDKLMATSYVARKEQIEKEEERERMEKEKEETMKEIAEDKDETGDQYAEEEKESSKTTNDEQIGALEEPSIDQVHMDSSFLNFILSSLLLIFFSCYIYLSVILCGGFLKQWKFNNYDRPYM